MQLALGLLHSQAMPTPTAAELAQTFGGKTIVSQDQLLLCSAAQDDSDVEIQGPDFLFMVGPPKACVNSAASGVGIACERGRPDAQQCSSWTFHGPVFGVQHSVPTLWWCWLNRSHCNLNQSKTGTAQQFVEVFSLLFWDHDFKDREAKQDASG